MARPFSEQEDVIILRGDPVAQTRKRLIAAGFAARSENSIRTRRSRLRRGLAAQVGTPDAMVDVGDAGSRLYLAVSERINTLAQLQTLREGVVELEEKVEGLNQHIEELVQEVHEMSGYPTGDPF